MTPSRGLGILVLTLVGVSGCAGMPQRGTTSSPMEAPAVSAPARPTGWRGWWSRWTAPRAAPAATPAHVPAATFDPDLPIETSRRVGPERNIWPDRSQSALSRLLPPGLKPKAVDGPTLGQTQPTPKMTAAEANRAIAALARPRKTVDDRVLPVRMWDDADRPSAMPTPTFDDEPAATELAAPIPVPGPLIERFSTQSEPKRDPAARNTSGSERRVDVDPAEDAGPPPLVGRDPEATPALASVAQAPPPPPVRPSPRVEPTPPPPTIEETPPAAPAVDQPAEPVKPAEPKDEASPPVSSDEPAPEAPSPSLPVAPPSDAAAAAVAPSAPSATVEGPTALAAAPQTNRVVAPTLIASKPTAASESHHWSLLKWFRPQQTEHRHPHHPGVFPSAQGPVEMPQVLVPTSYYASLAPPSAPASSRQNVTPTMQQAFVMPSPQGPTPTCEPKKPCALVTRLHERVDQYRQWKHAHICKHIQSLKDMLAGKNRCQACGGAGAGPIPSAQAAPSPQERPTAPAPQAQTHSWSLFRLGSTD